MVGFGALFPVVEKLPDFSNSTCCSFQLFANRDVKKNSDSFEFYDYGDVVKKEERKKGITPAKEQAMYALA